MRVSYEENFGQPYTDNLPTLGEVMSKVIKFFGGNEIYGVGGDFAANLIAALDNEVSICPSSNEMHAGFSACAQAELNGMGFCLTTYMVGSLPCTSAAAMAVTESLPVIFISGAPGEQEVNTQAIHHTIHPTSAWKTQYDNALRAFESLGVKVERLQGDRTSGQPNVAGNRFFHLLAHAYKTKQPVFIEIPRDLVKAKTQSINLPNSLEHIHWSEYVLSGSELIAAQIVGKLNEAQAPILYLGDKLKHNKQLKSLIIEFAEKFNIPFATSWFAKGLFDEFHPLSLNCYNGIFSQTAGRDYIENGADYVLDVATSICIQDTNTAFGTGTHKIENMKNKTLLKGGTVLEKDIVEVFEHLIKSDIKQSKFTPFNQNLSHMAQRLNREDDIDFDNLAITLNEIQENNDRPFIYLPEVGNSYFASYSLKVRANQLGRGWLTNPWYGAMGTAIPYARVVAKQIKQQQLNARAVVVIGDGGFHFQLNELIELLKDRTDVVIIYMRNNVFHLGKSGDQDIYHCNDDGFNVSAIIKAYQGMYYTCKSVAEFNNVFNSALDRSGINLIEIRANPIEEKQCNELRLLNLYIKAKNGDKVSQEKWSAITS